MLILSKIMKADDGLVAVKTINFFLIRYSPSSSQILLSSSRMRIFFDPIITFASSINLQGFRNLEGLGNSLFETLKVLLQNYERINYPISFS